jgi:hypothetical protein
VKDSEMRFLSMSCGYEISGAALGQPLFRLKINHERHGGCLLHRLSRLQLRQDSKGCASERTEIRDSPIHQFFLLVRVTRLMCMPAGCAIADCCRAYLRNDSAECDTKVYTKP